MTIDATNATAAAFPFRIDLKRGVPLWGNFVVCLMWLMVFPVFSFWRFHRFEYTRWAEADQSPYQWIGDVGEGLTNAIAEDD